MSLASTQAPAPDPCAAVATPDTGRSAPDTLVIALHDSVDVRHAPVPRNGAEQFVFGQLYETLIRVDCEGRLRPALAASWRSDDGRRWTFTLRDSALFWDGAPVAAQYAVARFVAGDSAWWTRVQALSGREVRVLAGDSTGEPPAWLGDPALAVVKPPRGPGLTLGSGAFRLTVDSVDAALRAVPMNGLRPVLEFRAAAGVDGRDLLDSEVDLLVTDDPATLAYAARLPDYATQPLPWSRAYVVVWQLDGPPPGASADLARGVRVEARPAEGPFWFEGVGPCAALDSARAAPRRAPAVVRRIVYDRADRTARELAERLVALGALGPGAVATGLPVDRLFEALRTGTAGAYVFALPTRDLHATRDPCGAATALPWMVFHGVLRSLIETRPRAVLRRTVPGITVDWDGTIRLLRTAP